MTSRFNASPMQERIAGTASQRSDAARQRLVSYLYCSPAPPSPTDLIMSHQVILQQIRNQIRDRFERLGADSTHPIIETILIRNGYYCGRRFEQDRLTAVWFILENQIKCFDRTGALLEVSAPRWEHAVVHAEAA